MSLYRCLYIVEAQAHTHTVHADLPIIYTDTYNYVHTLHMRSFVRSVYLYVCKFLRYSRTIVTVVV
jgi:hypothetical protein